MGDRRRAGGLRSVAVRARRPAAIRKVGVAVATGNTVFAAASVTAVLAGWLPLTGAGTELLLGFVAATAALAWLQYRGVRRLA